MRRSIREEPEGPVIESDIRILGREYSCLTQTQPLPITWFWDDGQSAAENYQLILNELGTGKCIVYLLADFLLLTAHAFQQSGLVAISTIIWIP